MWYLVFDMVFNIAEMGKVGLGCLSIFAMKKILCCTIRNINRENELRPTLQCTVFLIRKLNTELSLRQLFSILSSSPVRAAQHLCS